MEGRKDLYQELKEKFWPTFWVSTVRPYGIIAKPWSQSYDFGIYNCSASVVVS
jgi:hypothetical protein